MPHNVAVMDWRIRKALQLVIVGLNKGELPPLETVCDAVNLSRSRVRHLFKTEVGMSFTHYVRMRQMEEARRLLETSFLNVKQVMTRVGFNDGSHFTRDFKRAYGTSPTKYRHDHWNTVAYTGDGLDAAP
jgi:AraC family transcriptional regulator, arabinose operon regulatory protein